MLANAEELEPTFGFGHSGGQRTGPNSHGVAPLPFALFLGQHIVVRWTGIMCFGAWNLTGLLGLRHYEYRVTDGR